MKKSILFCIFILFISFCTQKMEEVEKKMEDGVEVVINHIEPYKLKGEPSTFTLKKVLSIALDRDEMVNIGLTNIYDFDVDSNGNIYILDSRSYENLIFKFDKKGNFINSFCRYGEGPGELIKSQKITMRITQKNEIKVYSKMKFIFFRQDGSLIREVKSKKDFSDARYIENGNYLCKIVQGSGEASFTSIYALYDSQFNKIKELDEIKAPTGFAQHPKGIYYNIAAAINGDKIFTSNQERDYEIYVYDFDGNLIRKIKKEYKKIQPSEEYKERFFYMWKGTPVYEAVKKRFYFPSSLPPFHYFISDDRGRIYVMTYEKGNNPDEFIFDIFNSEGIFIGLKSIKVLFSSDHLNENIKNDHFYSLVENENDFQQLNVYKMIWK